MTMPNYVECAGVRTPQDWSREELVEALGKRNVRFNNEGDIVAAFDAFLETQAKLKDSIESLRRMKREASEIICPECRKRFALTP